MSHNAVAIRGSAAAAPVEAIDFEKVNEIAQRFSLRDFQREAVVKLLGKLHDRGNVYVAAIPAGAGKTRLGVGIAAYSIAKGYDVLWLAKSWGLINQAVEEFNVLAPEYRDAIRRIGGDRTLSRHQHGGVERIYFTTVQTWYAQRGKLPCRARPSARQIVIWDEAHWGMFSLMGRAIRKDYLGVAAVYGLTATPVVGDQVQVAYEHAPCNLWGPVLATPQIREVSTGIAWAPTIQDEDFAPQSLRKLGKNRPRNKIILDELGSGRRQGRYNRVLVFACDIAHADELHRLMAERGIDARVVHSQLPHDTRDAAIKHFCDGRAGVLINVCMLAEGFNLPEIDTVFLARPTRSRTLLTQMIGRGTRKTPTKNQFWVVEFNDDLDRLGAEVVHTSAILQGTDTCDRPRLYVPPVRHYAPTEAPRFEIFTTPGYGAIPIAIGQTFGVEIEITGPNGIPPPGPTWDRGAKILIERLQDSARRVYPDAQQDSRSCLDAWHLKNDSSAGWEIVSPVLRDAEGFNELGVVCRGLADLVNADPEHFHINHRTGLHITLATQLNSDERLRGFLRRVQRLEPGLFTLVSPSRLYSFCGYGKGYSRKQGHHYCKPVRSMGEIDCLPLNQFMQIHGHRYHAVNLTRFQENVQLLEVRMHNGTVSFPKIALWVSLWMQVFNCSRYVWTGAGATGKVLSRRNSPIRVEQAAQEDIVALLVAEGIPMTKEFERLLKARRLELREWWRQVLPRRVASWEKAGWYL